MLAWWLNGKKSACNAGNPGLIPGLGRSSGERNGYPLQYSCLENSMDRASWRASMRLQRVGHNWATDTLTNTFHWFKHLEIFMEFTLLFLNTYFFGCTRSHMGHMASSVLYVACGIFSCIMRTPSWGFGI